MVQGYWLYSSLISTRSRLTSQLGLGKEWEVHVEAILGWSLIFEQEREWRDSRNHWRTVIVDWNRIRVGFRSSAIRVRHRLHLIRCLALSFRSAIAIRSSSLHLHSVGAWFPFATLDPITQWEKKWAHLFIEFERAIADHKSLHCFTLWGAENLGGSIIGYIDLYFRSQWFQYWMLIYYSKHWTIK